MTTETNKTRADKMHEQRMRIKASRLMLWFLAALSLTITGLAIAQQSPVGAAMGIVLSFIAAGLGVAIYRMRQTLDEMTLTPA